MATTPPVNVTNDPPPSSARSYLMARVRGKNTKPELIVRSAAHSLGFRFRLHKRGLPGTPDIVFAGRRKVIFVHGCFWHRHKDCPKASTPKTRIDFWKDKFRANVTRDQKSVQKLEKDGWKVLTVWECQVRDTDQLKEILKGFLRNDD